jgi:hypothetical protein
VQGAFFLDIVITHRSSIFQLLSGKDQSLLLNGHPNVFADDTFGSFNGCVTLNANIDSFSRESLDKDLHAPSRPPGNA